MPLPTTTYLYHRRRRKRQQMTKCPLTYLRTKISSRDCRVAPRQSCGFAVHVSDRECHLRTLRKQNTKNKRRLMRKSISWITSIVLSIAYRETGLRGDRRSLVNQRRPATSSLYCCLLPLSTAAPSAASQPSTDVKPFFALLHDLAASDSASVNAPSQTVMLS